LASPPERASALTQCVPSIIELSHAATLVTQITHVHPINFPCSVTCFTRLLKINYTQHNNVTSYQTSLEQYCLSSPPIQQVSFRLIFHIFSDCVHRCCEVVSIKRCPLSPKILQSTITIMLVCCRNLLSFCTRPHRRQSSIAGNRQTDTVLLHRSE